MSGRNGVRPENGWILHFLVILTGDDKGPDAAVRYPVSEHTFMTERFRGLPVISRSSTAERRESIVAPLKLGIIPDLLGQKYGKSPDGIYYPIDTSFFIGPAVHLRGVVGGSVAGEAEEFGDRDDLIATSLELGNDGLHGLDGTLVGVVE